MGFFDKLFGQGNDQKAQQPVQAPQYGSSGAQSQIPASGQLTDEQAVARYRYMLQTAPPDAIEQAHQEAFSRLTPEQRSMVLGQLSSTVSPSERAAGMGTQDDPQSLARLATRAEMRQPGTLERTFGGMGIGGGMGMGGLMAGSFFSSMAGMFVGSMIANQFFGHSDYAQGFADGEAADNGADANGQADGGQNSGTDTVSSDNSDYASTNDSTGYDSGYGDNVAGDVGGFGGGDLGGGDFGGGDFGGGNF